MNSTERHPLHNTDLPRRRILRTPDAAAYLGLSASTLEKMRSKGGGPRFKRLGGRAIGYDVRDLDRWLDGQRDEMDPEPSSHA